MERMIIFGVARSYISPDGEKRYLCDYMSEDGITHRDFLNASIFNKISPYNVVPGTNVVGIFDVDSFNKLSLVDLKL